MADESRETDSAPEQKPVAPRDDSVAGTARGAHVEVAAELKALKDAVSDFRKGWLKLPKK